MPSFRPNHAYTHTPPPPQFGHAEQYAHAQALVLRYGWDATAFQILNPGISLWFSADGEAVVGYVESGGYRMVAASPICPPDALSTVSAAFEEEARQMGMKVCYFGVQERMMAILAARGTFSRLLLGAQPVWNPHQWEMVLSRKASLRAQISRSRNKQVEVERWGRESAENHPELEQCLAEWLHTRGLPPMHFLVEPNTLSALEHRRVYVASRGEKKVGFLIASPVPLRNGWLIEQIIRCDRAPNGTSELLINAAMHDAAASGADYVTLGLSPLSHRAKVWCPPRPLWLKILFAWTRAHGRRFYNFEGLDTFKAKMLPDRWEPLYAITNEPRLSWHLIYAIAGAFGGMSPVIFVGRGLLRAARRECVWAGKNLSRTAKKVGL